LYKAGESLDTPPEWRRSGVGTKKTGAITTEFAASVRSSILSLSMEPKVGEGERRQRGSMETRRAVADADHGITD
jgi:hypothetical protein